MPEAGIGWTKRVEGFDPGARRSTIDRIGSAPCSFGKPRHKECRYAALVLGTAWQAMALGVALRG